MATIVPNTFQCPNAHVDRALPYLEGDTYKCLNLAVRDILGWQDRIADKQARISLSRFMAGTGLTRPQVSKHLKLLTKYKLLLKVGTATQNGQMWELGMAPDWSKLEADFNERKTAGRKKTQQARKTAKAKRESQGGSVNNTTKENDLTAVGGSVDNTAGGSVDNTTGGSVNNTHIKPLLQNHTSKPKDTNVSASADAPSDAALAISQTSDPDPDALFDEAVTRALTTIKAPEQVPETIPAMYDEPIEPQSNAEWQKQRNKDISSIIKIHLDTGVIERKPGAAYQNKTNRSWAEALLNAGFTPDYIRQYVDHLKEDSWWANKSVSLKYIAENIKAWDGMTEDPDPEPEYMREFVPDDTPPKYAKEVAEGNSILLQLMSVDHVLGNAS